MSPGITGLGFIANSNGSQPIPDGSLFTNVAHLFWHLPEDDRMGMYPWLIWFIWKARNDKVFSNDDWDPNDTINLAARRHCMGQGPGKTRGCAPASRAISRYPVSG
ncbi:unnamed protein product [Microthlaspi erraticum]|uniref:Uncharacterized protein n=1 Tax=Microthlaspi erraticum TaxID=1685480 RepID=A0A6D2JK05_9BRAS|nr:unnamed protein product [Microthlaspi erraticum]